MNTQTYLKLSKITDDILIYINSDHQIKFSKVFEFPESPGSLLGHINIWEDNAPFYFLFTRNDTHKLNMPGYHKCTFIANGFKYSFDKKGKLYLRSTDLDHSNCYLKYHPIKSISDIRKLVELRNSGHEIYASFPKKGKLGIGEAFEIIRIK